MAALNNPVLRFGHVEGLTQVCYSRNGEFLISCGYDGEVRIWKDIDDDDPNTITAGEKAFSIATKESTLFIASDNNSVDRYILPGGESDGVLVRFTGNVTSICISESKKFVAAGSSDFDIKIINLDTKKQKSYLGHQAPVLCVAIDPNDEFLASTSCDGKLKIWNLQTEACVKSIDVIPPSNDVSNSECLARLCWRPTTGEDLIVTVPDGVKIFSRVTWVLYHVLTTTVTTKAFQCSTFSPCGRFVAGASVDGWIAIWDAETKGCLRTLQHPKKSFICSLAWDPRENNSMAFSDFRGQVGVINDFVPSEQSSHKDINDLDALFEEEDDNMMIDMMAEEDKQQEEEIAILKKRAKINPINSDDDEDQPEKNNLPPIPSTLDVLARDDDAFNELASSPGDENITDVISSSHAPASTKYHPPSIAMQPPFQPGSTPSHLTHRFMAWNAVGLIRAYNDEIESAIDIEFHNTHTHHALHIDNTARYTMADLSDKAVVLASESSDEAPSKIKCIHFSSWDSNKEWTLDMNRDEEIQAVTIGDCWFAVCTDALQVRLLSLGGVQRQIFSISGPVVAMAAHTDQLLVVYHTSQGLGRNQCLGFMLIEVGAGSGCNPRNIVGGSHFPISPGSTLSWLGFTAEGTPASVDSKGVVRMFNRKFCGTWTQAANTKEMTKSRHDNYWVVGLHESPQQIRCILCKGALYPSTLPRPTLTVLGYNLPLCEMESDRSKLEEEYWRVSLLSSHSDYLTARGYEPDIEGKKKSDLQIQHTLMKLFALCCKSDSEFQAMEVSSLMPTSASINLAIKYSSRMRKIMLAQKLQEVARDKMEQERNVESEEEEEEEDFRTGMQAGYSTSASEWETPSTSRLDEPVEKSDEIVSLSPRHKPSEPKSKPTRSLSSQLAGTRKNPFKTSNPSSSSAPSTGHVLDEIKRATPVIHHRTVGEKNKKTKSKDERKKAKSTQSTLKINLTSTPKQKKQTPRSPDHPSSNHVEVLQETSTNQNESESASSSTKSGVYNFIDHHLEELREKNPDVNGVELRKMTIKMFRSLDPAEKQKWNGRDKDSNSEPAALKRKHDSQSDDGDENSPPTHQSTNQLEALSKSRKLSTNEPLEASSDKQTRSKLLAFAYSGE